MPIYYLDLRISVNKKYSNPVENKQNRMQILGRIDNLEDEIENIKNVLRENVNIIEKKEKIKELNEQINSLEEKIKEIMRR